MAASNFWLKRRERSWSHKCKISACCKRSRKSATSVKDPDKKFHQPQRLDRWCDGCRMGIRPEPPSALATPVKVLVFVSSIWPGFQPLARRSRLRGWKFRQKNRRSKFRKRSEKFQPLTEMGSFDWSDTGEASRMLRQNFRRTANYWFSGARAAGERARYSRLMWCK